jgi:hypothetical protein
MDNFGIDIIAEGQETLLKAIEIAFAHNAPGNRVESYHVTKLVSDDYHGLPKSVDGRNAIILRWMKAEKISEDDPVNLPFKLDAKGAADFAQRWLAEQDYGREPDHDGHNKKGWRIITSNWGFVGSDRAAVCAILPWWATYGK